MLRIKKKYYKNCLLRVNWIVKVSFLFLSAPVKSDFKMGVEGKRREVE